VRIGRKTRKATNEELDEHKWQTVGDKTNKADKSKDLVLEMKWKKSKDVRGENTFVREVRKEKNLPELGAFHFLLGESGPEKSRPERC